MAARQKDNERARKRQSFPIDKAMGILRRTIEKLRVAPYVSEGARADRDPFRILISTILSLRTRDQPTQLAAEALFAIARTPRAMMQLPAEQIAEAIRPVLYYHNKARTIRDVSRRLEEEYGGRVPDEIDELLQFNGVGRKTANLVVTLAYGKPGICVDTHVHRIANRWGLVETKTPHETEFALRRRLPRRYWLAVNGWLVSFGQRICRPISPFCSQCPLLKYCAQMGVARRR